MQKWKQALSKKYFYHLYNLLSEHPWILEKQKALEDLWSICDDDKKKILIIDLLKRFQLITEDTRRPLERDIFNQILNVWQLPPENIVFLPIAYKEELDGSLWILDSLKQNLPDVISSKKLLNHLMYCNDTSLCGEDKYLIIVDDFIGSGHKLSRKLKYAKEHSVCKKIYCVCPVGMNAGIRYLEDNFPDIGFFVSKRLEKAVSDYYSDADDRKGTLQDLTNSYRLKKRIHYLGVGEAEALFSYKNRNIPNNVFPIFWGENDKNFEKFFRRRK